MTDPKNTRKQIITFLILTTVISTGIFIWMFSGAKDSIAAVIPMMYTPGISAIITTLIFKDKLRNYGWKPGKLRFLAYGFLVPVVVSVVGYGIVWMSKISDFIPDQVMNYKWAEMFGFDLPAPFLVGFF